jgi:hypothetical protein
MKKFDYSQAQKRIEFATKVIKLVTAILTLGLAVHSLLSVAFNYPEPTIDAELP